LAWRNIALALGRGFMISYIKLWSFRGFVDRKKKFRERLWIRNETFK